MVSGSCLCGNVSISYTQDPAIKALCHCTDCQKISGSTYSINNIVSESGFKVIGTPKSYTKTADSGNKITSYFCGDCGSTLFREGEDDPGMKVVKAGVLDGEGVLEESRPGVELFVANRSDWVVAVDGAEQRGIKQRDV